MQTIIAAYITGKNVQESYLFNTLQKVATLFKDCKILIFTTENILCSQNNIEVKNIGLKNKIAKVYWFNFTLAKKLKTATCFITNDKLYSKLNIPQYFFTAEDVTIIKPKSILKLKVATSIFVVEDFFKTALQNLLPAQSVINISHALYTEPLALSYNQTKSVQGEYTNGYDYFLYFVNLSSTKNIIIVLKAFSIIKKWQKTSMKLVLLLEDVPEENLIPDFHNYKYKEDVVFVQSTNKNKLQIIASAFACLYFGNYKFIKNVFSALQNNIPVIVTDSDLYKGIFNNAVTYAAGTEKSIAANMQLLYKDEQLKKELNTQAQIVLQNYNAEKAATDLYNIISVK